MFVNIFNARDAAETLNRMVLSVVTPNHPQAYKFSCYGYVCKALSRDDQIADDAEIVLLGPHGGERVIHAALFHRDEFIVDTMGGKATITGDEYRCEGPSGSAMTLHVKARIFVAEFDKKCTELYSSQLSQMPKIPAPKPPPHL